MILDGKDFASFGERLREVRLSRGLTQKELEERSGIWQSWISNIERGVFRSVRVSTLKKLADALGVRVGDLVVD